MAPASYTKFGEPRIDVRGNNFAIDVTPKCNFGCSFCYIADRPRGREMTFPEFKKIILEIAEYGKERGVKPSICIGGGEPFLHKGLVRFLSYATQILGRGRVEVTTNFSQFPVEEKAVVALLRRCGCPKLNLSIDREHLRFDPLAPKRLSAIFAATSALKSRVSVISVAKSATEARFRWPRAVSRVIPTKLKERVAKDYNVGRREFFSNPRSVSRLRKNLLAAKAGKDGALFMDSVSVLGGKASFGVSMGVNLFFSSDGKLYIDSPIDALHAPQLSIGSWRREALHDLITHNLPFKVNMIGEWMGELRSTGRKKISTGHYFNIPVRPNPKKEHLFASYALRRLDKLEAKRNHRH